MDCIKKKTKKCKILLAKAKRLRYTSNCCDMIAMKREVAAKSKAGFSAERMSRNQRNFMNEYPFGQETGDKSLYRV